MKKPILLEAAKKMLEKFDAADESGIFSDHAHDADLEKCPGCALDVASEDLRESIAAEEARGAKVESVVNEARKYVVSRGLQFGQQPLIYLKEALADLAAHDSKEKP